MREGLHRFWRWRENREVLRFYAVSCSWIGANAGFRSLIVVLVLVWVGVAGAAGQGTGSPSASVTQIAGIRRLSQDEAAEARPVHVRGVIFWTDGYGNKCIGVADDSAGIYVSVDAARNIGVLRESVEVVGSLKIGDEVEMDGVTGRGGFAPVLMPGSIRIVGQRSLPEPAVSPIAELLTGELDAQWVAAEGVVQSVSQSPWEPGRRILRLVGVGGSFVVAVNPAPWNDPDGVVDALVRVRGMALTMYNSRFNVTGMRVSVRRPEDLIVLTPPTADPFAASRVPISRARPFDSTGLDFHRRTIEGTVTFAGLNVIFIQDGDRGIRVVGWEGDPIEPGDRVVAACFVDSGRGVVSLSNALIRRIGHPGIPDPVRVTPSQIVMVDKANVGSDWSPLPADFDGCRVQFDATLVHEGAPTPPGQLSHWLRVETDDGTRVGVVLADETGFKPENFRPGAFIRLAGVASIIYSNSSAVPELLQPRDIKLFVRGAEDVSVLRPAPFWTRERRSVVIAVLGIVLAGSLLWVVALRRIVRTRTRRLEETMKIHRDAELEFDAVKCERHRLAGDLHDGLQQLFVSATFRVEAAAANLPALTPFVREQFVAARHALHRTQRSLRDAVWGLMVIDENSGDFAGLVRHAVSTMDHFPPGAVTVSVEGAPFPLARSAAGSLLLLVREAVSNSFRHGNARHVRIALRFTADAMELRVEDDGCGFEPGTVPAAHAGHFGLTSIRERMQMLGGTAQITSSPGDGACILAHLPRAGAEQGLDYPLPLRSPTATNGRDPIAGETRHD